MSIFVSLVRLAEPRRALLRWLGGADSERVRSSSLWTMAGFLTARTRDLHWSRFGYDDRGQDTCALAAVDGETLGATYLEDTKRS